MLMKKYIWRTAAVMMASAALLVSCVELEENQTEAVGYLVAPSLEIDVTVDDLLLTKALDFIVETPSEDKVYFVVKDKNQDVRYEGEGLWTAPLLLPAGTYTVEASYGENGFGAPYFYEKVTGTIDNQEYENLGTINVPLENSLVRVSVSDELKTHFTPTSVSFNDGEHTASCGDWVYVPSDVILKLAVSGNNEAGISAVYTHTFGSKTTPKMAYDVVCGTTDSNWPEITMQEISSANAWGSRIYITGSPDFTGEISQANMDKVIYEAIPADSDNWDSLAGASEVGSPVIKGLTPGTKYKVRARVGGLISKNSVEVTPTTDGLSVSAYHTTNAAGELDGTDVETVFTSPGKLISDAISGWKYQLYTADNATCLREFTDDADGSVTSIGSSISADGQYYPYIPHGSYKLKVTVKFADGGNPEEFVKDVNVMQPEFTVSASANTTYSYYTANNVSTANSKNAETVYDITSTVSIAETLLGNTKYSKPTVTYSVNGKTADGTYSASKTHTHQGEISGLSWGAHTLTASVTFDGVSKSGTCDCVITGLPYNVSFYGKTTAPSGWTIGGKIEWEGYGWNDGDSAKYLRLRGDGTFANCGYALSPAFSIPSTVLVKSVLDCFYYHSTVNSRQTIFVNASGDSVSQSSNNGTQIVSNAAFDDFANTDDVTNKIEMTNTMSRISITHGINSVDKGPLFNSTYFFGLKSLKIEYTLPNAE